MRGDEGCRLLDKTNRRCIKILNYEVVVAKIQGDTNKYHKNRLKS